MSFVPGAAITEPERSPMVGIAAEVGTLGADEGSRVSETNTLLAATTAMGADIIDVDVGLIGASWPAGAMVL
jgi:hypothetical protein